MVTKKAQHPQPEHYRELAEYWNDEPSVSMGVLLYIEFRHSSAGHRLHTLETRLTIFLFGSIGPVWLHIAPNIRHLHPGTPHSMCVL
jgi:hypothetical protein